MAEPSVSRANLDAELEIAQPFGEALGWIFERLGPLVVAVTMTAPERKGLREQYRFEFSYDDFPSKPPLIDVVHPETRERNAPKCFPTGHGYFHGKARICAGWSRRAYKEEFSDGPHDDFKCATWKQHAEGVTTLAEMLQELWKGINQQGYQGRDS